MSAQDTEELIEFRIERYAELGFTKKESEKLANSKQDDGWPLDYRVVRKALELNCTHSLAMKLFAD